MEAVCLQDKGIEFGVEFVELASGFVEVFVVEFGDAPLFFLHLGGAVGVEDYAVIFQPLHLEFLPYLTLHLHRPGCAASRMPSDIPETKRN